MKRFLLAFCLLAIAACSSDEPSSVSRADCTKLREHLIDLQLSGATRDPALAAQHREAHRRVLGDRFLDRCVASVTEDALACGLAADAESVARCALP